MAALPNFGIFTTAACSRQCRWCLSRARTAIPGPQQTDLEHVQLLLTRFREYGLGAQQWVLTGGEPTLWPQLRPALQLLREAQLGPVRIWTNGKQIAPLVECRGLYDELCVTVYRDTALAAVRQAVGTSARLIERHGVRHRPWPHDLIPFPAGECACFFPTLFRERIFTCEQIITRVLTGPVAALARYSTAVTNDFRDFLTPAVRRSRVDYSPLCTTCPASAPALATPRETWVVE